MKIRIEDDFDSDLESKYKSIDNDTVIGNGALSNNNIPIIDVASEEVSKNDRGKTIDNEVIKKDEVHKYNFNTGYSIEIQGATIVDDVYKDTNSSINENVKDNINSNKPTKRYEDNREKLNKSKSINGKIIVYVKLGDIKGRSISEAKINLYALNGLSPKLVSSKLTNENGMVIFDELAEGSYRVIEIVNRKYFEKPTYIQWNEVTINEDLRKETIIIVNRIKKYQK